MRCRAQARTGRAMTIPPRSTASSFPSDPRARSDRTTMKPSPVRFIRPARAPRQPGTSSRLDIHIPIRTLITLTLWFAGLWFFTTLSSLILQLVIGFMLASAFTPLVIWLGKRGVSRGGAVALIGAGLLLG